MSTPEQTPAPQAQRRQYVNFAFYKIDPAWRRLPESERTKGKQEFLRAVEEYTGKVLVVAYSSVGIRGDCDIMLWRISYELELFQDMTTKILASGLGQYLTTPYSYLDHQAVGLRGSSHARKSREQASHRRARQSQVYFRLPIPQDARLVPAHESGAAGHDGRAH